METSLSGARGGTNLAGPVDIAAVAFLSDDSGLIILDAETATIFRLSLPA